VVRIIPGRRSENEVPIKVKEEECKKMKNTKILFAVFALLYAASTVSAYDPLGLNLPNGTVTLVVAGMATDTAMMYINLENVPEGYAVSNGQYLGWCVNPDKPLYYPNYLYYARLYSSYDTELPETARSVNWNKINYMVNAYRKGELADACYGLPVRDDEIQTLMWKYLGYDKNWGAPSPNCLGTLETVVDENSASYVPGEGDSVGVICDNGNDWQVVFIEIAYKPIATAPEVAGLAMAIAMVAPAFGYLLVKKRK